MTLFVAVALIGEVRNVALDVHLLCLVVDIAADSHRLGEFQGYLQHVL